MDPERPRQPDMVKQRPEVPSSRLVRPPQRLARHPRENPRGPQRAQDDPKTGPRGPKMSPRGPHKGLPSKVMRGSMSKLKNQRFASTGARFEGVGQGQRWPEMGSNSAPNRPQVGREGSEGGVGPKKWPGRRSRTRHAAQDGSGRPTAAWKRGRDLKKLKSS